MNTTAARLFSTLIASVALVAGAVGCHHEGKATHAAVASAPAVDRDAPLVPKNHPELAFYSARVQGEAQTKVFVRDTSGKAAQLVYVDVAPGELVRVSNDGAHGVYRRFISPGLTQEVEIDFRTNES